MNTENAMADRDNTTVLRRLPEFDAPFPDAMALFRQWFKRAGNLGVAEPGALSLATVDEQGRPSNRIVQIVDVRADGPVFTSHRGSQKGRDLAVTKWASGVLYWRESKQQVILTGPVDRLDDDDADALWQARPADTHPMSVASRQSETLKDEEALRAEAGRLASLRIPLERPAGWSGYILKPAAVEFWMASPDRLHHRLRYERAGTASWTSLRLQP
jgi:pyridoxamine 5'-phosphate oxidase